MIEYWELIAKNWRLKAAPLVENIDQPRFLPRQERPVGDLAGESWRPSAGNKRTAGETCSFGSQPIILDEVAISLDERDPALVTLRVLLIANHARQVSGINVFQACILSDCHRTQ